MTFTSFTTWAEVLAAVEKGEYLWYRAPFDFTPRSVRCELRRGKKLRVFPWTKGDPFTADAGHLSRFVKETRP